MSSSWRDAQVKGKSLSYTAYGLHIESELHLTGLTVSEPDKPDVSVRLGKIGVTPPRDRPYQGCFHAMPREACFFWEGKGSYLVRDGCEIVVDPAPEADERTLGLVILGIALGTLLHQRGLLTFHGSAIAFDDGAVAFLGAKRAGKSATAAALHAHGYAMMSDDIVAVDMADMVSPTILPGFPQLKLWPDVARSLDIDPNTLPRLHPLLEKRAYCVVNGFLQKPLPLRCIYILTNDTKLHTEPLRPRESFLELTRHSYALRFLGTAGVNASHFQQRVALAGAVPCFYLSKPSALSALPDLARFVESHLASIVGRTAA